MYDIGSIPGKMCEPRFFIRQYKMVGWIFFHSRLQRSFNHETNWPTWIFRSTNIDDLEDKDKRLRPSYINIRKKDGIF